MNPLVGITTYGRVERPAPTGHYAEHYTLPAMYVDAVRRAGGVPVLLPPGEENWQVWLDRCDAFLVSGGTDIDPSRYGRPRTERIEKADHERDESELTLTSALVERRQPALFVCRGLQALNVALGGTLHGHIPDLAIGDIHRDVVGSWAYHDVTAVEGSLVAEAMGTLVAKPVSGHHQAIDELADPLRVTATAPDGLIEAVELSDHPHLVGVQWHPEVTAAEDPTQQGLFDQLVAAAE